MIMAVNAPLSSLGNCQSAKKNKKINRNNQMPVTNSIYDLIGMCRLSQLTENIFVRFANVVDDLALSVKSLITSFGV